MEKVNGIDLAVAKVFIADLKERGLMSVLEQERTLAENLKSVGMDKSYGSFDSLTLSFELPGGGSVHVHFQRPKAKKAEAK